MSHCRASVPFVQNSLSISFDCLHPCCCSQGPDKLQPIGWCSQAMRPPDICNNAMAQIWHCTSVAKCTLHDGWPQHWVPISVDIQVQLSAVWLLRESWYTTSSKLRHASQQSSSAYQSMEAVKQVSAWEWYRIQEEVQEHVPWQCANWQQDINCAMPYSGTGHCPDTKQLSKQLIRWAPQQYSWFPCWELMTRVTMHKIGKCDDMLPIPEL